MRVILLVAAVVAVMANEQLPLDPPSVLCDGCVPDRPSIKLCTSINRARTGSNWKVTQYGMFDGYRLGVQTINRKGGVFLDGVAHNLEFLYYDNNGDIDALKSQTMALAGPHGCFAILSDFGAKPIQTGIMLAEQLKVPYLSPVGAVEALWSDKRRYSFGFLASLAESGRQLIQMLERAAAAGCITPKIAVVYRAAPQGHDFLLAFDEWETEFEFEYFGYEWTNYWATPEVDIAMEVLSPLVGQGYNVLLGDGGPMELVAFGEAAEALGHDWLYEGWNSGAAQTEMGGVNGRIYVTWWNSLLHFPEIVDFISDWYDLELKSETGDRQAPVPFGATSFQVVSTLAATIEQVGALDREAVIDKLLSFTEANPIGQSERFPVILPGQQVYFRESGQIGALPALVQFECDDDDDFNILAPQSDATAGGFGKLFYSCWCRKKVDPTVVCPTECPGMKALRDGEDPILLLELEDRSESNVRRPTVGVLVLLALAISLLSF